MKKHKIVLLSDNLQGGAALVPNLLANDLSAQEGYEVHRWHFTPPATPAFFQPSVQEKSLYRNRKRPFVERIVKNFSKKVASVMRHKRNELALLEAVKRERPDLIHVHNIHSADIDHSTLQKLPADIPIVWTLHDFWPLKAIAFSWSEREDKQLQRYKIGTWSRAALLQKRDAFFSQRKNLTLVAPSAYVQRVVRHYAARHQVPCAVIPYVINRGFFRPQDHAAAAEKWGLTSDKTWIGIGSTWNNSRKGMDVLWRALAHADCRSLGLLIWGHESNQQPIIKDLTIRNAGYVSETDRVASLYAAVDAFICPTKADTGPLTVMESMAVGTPVLASRVGGIPERISHGESGLLFPSQDHLALAALLEDIQKDIWPLKELGERARSFALQNFEPQRQVHQHMDLYQSVLQRTP
ncbi:glycosyltransferase [Prosthecobacter fluviatilis]|uniref:Glycosyltransferase n=1 Tax=Prosthecobacter fluviatilis TaxID=445931 RepID=A0ABW0KKD6_9BACT